MPDAFEEFVEAAELAVFARKKASLDAAADAGLPGRFESFHMGGLRASMATADQYGFLNAIEGVTDQSVAVLPDVLRRFPDPRRPAIVAAFPSPELIDWLLVAGYKPAPARPLTYLRPGTDFPTAEMSAEKWQIREVSTKEETMVFLDLLDAGYAATREVGALIRAEHALPIIRGFIASRNDQPLAAAAMSLHATGAVIGGASTLPTARGTGAQSALLAHRLRLVETLGVPLATATAASGTPSIRNLAKLGFTIIERTAWRFNR
ncbi:GNAT family N-acetyltransferase [Micrococcaceae bacterium Sec5.7]